MEWLESHIARIDRFCNTLDNGQTTYLHVPKICPYKEEDCECGMEYRINSKETSDKNINDCKDMYINTQQYRPLNNRIIRYHEILNEKSNRTLPVSVIVSDRNGSTSSCAPSPTSSLSPDSFNNDIDSEKGYRHVNDDDEAVNKSIQEDDAKNKSYTYKPQPMVPKSQRQFISAERKDSTYWERRKRNNEAAKRSRESRREKEIEVNRKCKDLEKENTGMRFTIVNLQERNAQLEDTLKIYKEILIKNNLI